MSDDTPAAPDFQAGVASSDVRNDQMLSGTCGDDKVLVLRKHGKLCALSRECTHLGADLAGGALTGTSLRCPWHHARFDIHTGEAVGAPAFEPLSRYEVSEQDGRIVVGKKLSPVPPRAGRLDKRLDRHVVIVGAGAAGHACAEWLARRGAGQQVTLIGDETAAPYDRTFCSKQILGGKKTAADAALAALPGVELLSGTAVTGLDAGARQLTLADGKTLSYDALVLATGATPVVPDFKGADDARVHLLRTLEDTQTIVAAARNAKHVGIVGASFIALEAAASLRAHELTVTVIAPDEIPLAAKMGEEVGRFVQQLHEQHGVRFKLGRTVKAFEDGQLQLDDGSRVKAEIVIAGIGVKPRLELAQAAKLRLASQAHGGGVQVDHRLLTSDPAIYAIGDIACFTDARLDAAMRVEHWVVAQRQGQFVARHLLGESETYVDTAFFWSGHYDKSLRYVGHGKPAAREIDGTVEVGDFQVRYLDGETTAAQLGCGRDQALLETEAEWDAEALGTDTEFGDKA